MDNIFWLVLLSTSFWVFFDAKKIGVRKGLISGIADMNPAMWLIACIFLWIVAFPIYLIKRSELKKAAAVMGAELAGVNGMVFCRGCGKQIHSSAKSCPHCGVAY